MLLTLLATASAASALNINGFSYTGNVSADGNTATICINGSVAQNTYIGFGVAKSAGTMSGADLTIAFADATGAVKVLHGSGSSAPAFVQDATSPLTTATNSYTNGVLNVCFSRPLAGSGSVLPLSATASGNFLWATGTVNNGIPLQHTTKGGFAGSLFASATGPSSSAAAAASSTTKSGAISSVLDSSIAIALALVAVLVA